MVKKTRPTDYRLILKHFLLKGRFMQPVSMSHAFSPWTPGVLSLVLYASAILVAIGVLLFLVAWLGEKKQCLEKQRPYECGIIPTRPAHFRYPVPFYLVAVFFLIFDVEAAYIFAWAVSFEELGWAGYLRIIIFIVILLLSLFYVWKKGGLDWKNPE
jgi:NADH-quinone oxidoreductase subunit A